MLKRVIKQLRDHELQPAYGVLIEPTLFPPTEAIQRYSLNAFIVGPEQSPYEGGLFRLLIELSADYPFKPPIMKFLTKVYHPNINCYGNISLCSMLCNHGNSSSWSPAFTIQKALIAIRTLLIEPDPDNPYVPEIALEYKRDRQKFNQSAAQWCQKYAE